MEESYRDGKPNAPYPGERAPLRGLRSAESLRPMLGRLAFAGLLVPTTLVAQGTPCVSRRSGSVPAAYAATVARERMLVCERLATRIPGVQVAVAERETRVVGGVRLRRRRSQAAGHTRDAVPHRERIEAAHGHRRRPVVRAGEARSRRTVATLRAVVPGQRLPDLHSATDRSSRRHQALQGSGILPEPPFRHGAGRAQNLPGRLAPVPARHAILVLELRLESRRGGGGGRVGG